MAPKPFPVSQLSQPPPSGGSLPASWPGSLRPGPGMPHDQPSWSLHPHDDENRSMFPLGCGVSLKENYHVTQFKASETVEGCVTGKTNISHLRQDLHCCFMLKHMSSTQNTARFASTPKILAANDELLANIKLTGFLLIFVCIVF